MKTSQQTPVCTLCFLEVYGVLIAIQTPGIKLIRFISHLLQWGWAAVFLSGQRAWTWTGLCLVSLTPKGRKINPCASLSLNTWEIMKGRDSGCSCWGYFLQIRDHNNNSTGWNLCFIMVVFLSDTKLSPPGSASFCGCCFPGSNQSSR